MARTGWLAADSIRRYVGELISHEEVRPEPAPLVEPHRTSAAVQDQLYALFWFVRSFENERNGNV